MCVALLFTAKFLLAGLPGKSAGDEIERMRDLDPEELANEVSQTQIS